MAKKKKIAVVTGASGGLGREFVRLLLREEQVDEIWAIARNEKKLCDLKRKGGGKIQTYPMDLSDRRALKDFEQVLRNGEIEITYLVNNAGYGIFASCEDLGLEESLDIIDVNCGAVVAMGSLCIPYMKRGAHVINIASQASFQPLPYLNLYSAAKAFVRCYSRALHVELEEKGISVTAVCPGWLDTGFFERADIGAKKTVRRYMGMTKPMRTAKKALRDAKCGRDISVCGIYVKCGHVLAKLLPQRMMMKLWLRQQRL